MTWTGIYNKYKNTKLMKEFMWYYAGDEEAIINDIWGYLICFAETKGHAINIMTGWVRKSRYENCRVYDNINEKDYGEQFRTSEQAMLWCAEKFFEAVK